VAALPEDVRRDVIRALYEQFDDMRWEQVSTSSASSAYERFLEDPRIGGLLSVYLPRGQVRVWIKDGPAKEYRRALEGIGPYAAFTGRQFAGPQAIVEASLGSGWLVTPGSLDHKPMRCRARKGGEECLVVWGAVSSLKELIWTASLHRATKSPVPVHVVVTKFGSAPLPADDSRMLESLCEVVGALPHQATVAITRKPAWNPPK
jgi:hypothetical protein